MDKSLWEILNMGGYAMWVILAFSVLAVAVAVERAIVQWKFMDRARGLAETVGRCLQKGALEEARSACERSTSPLAEVFLVGYERQGRTKTENVVAAVHRERVRVVTDLRARLWMLGTIGATAPFVGLFGTVIGILNAFAEIYKTGTNDFSKISGPISEALYATAFGILVAVEAVIIFNFFNQRLSRINVELKMLTDEFLEQLEEHGPRAGARRTRGGAEEEEANGDREAA
jgi:biopolymer transport protein ExbB/TolQ